jgi:uncharacterized protein
MRQILIIHGGDSFSSYEEYLHNLKQTELTYDRLLQKRRWKDNIIDTFPEADVLTPQMPNSANAQYDEWTIWFEKILPLLGDNVSIIGHSLGAMFLAKYLHSQPLHKPIKQLVLLAAGYDEEAEGYGQFKIKSATGLERNAHEIHIMHSRDDFIVPYEALDKFARDIPTATIHRFTDRNHFLDEDFPELIEILEKYK